MSVQQIVTPLTKSALFLVLTVNDDADPAQVRDAVSSLAGLVRTVGFRVPADELSAIVGIGSDLWDRLFEGSPRPKHLHPFRPIEGDPHRAVATPGDLLFHIRSQQLGSAFELARLITESLEGLATVVDEVHGFRFYDQRDLLGFVDGTENPTGAKAAQAVAVGDEDPEFAGSSYVMVQKYLHNLDAWNALSVDEQERVIGRSKADDIEMDDETKPSNSHTALNVISDDDGRQLQILRLNMPFGEVGTRDFGTYFIAYASDPRIPERMLSNMFLGDPRGNYDRILDFSTAVTGSLFFVPTEDFLSSAAD